MPEFVPAKIAELRNLAIYDYGMDADELVCRTLRNSVPNWRRGVDRVVDGVAVAEFGSVRRPLPTPGSWPPSHLGSA